MNRRMVRSALCTVFFFCLWLLGSAWAIELHSLDDENLLNLVQRQTLRYFWEEAHPVSFMAPERNTTPNCVTTGGTGFGLMAWVVGCERGWLPRREVLRRAHVLVDYLTKADRWHGAWPHWLDGATGKVVPFWKKDDGADLVETSYLIMGLLTLDSYFCRPDLAERTLREKIRRLWREVEWTWFTRGENVLYWHWSPNYGWEMNHRIRGWNECLITYLLAASSPTHSIAPKVYHEGWAGSDHFRNGNRYYGLPPLPLGEKLGGPLFFSHYSFLGIDPRGLRDAYADYGDQTRLHSLINYYYCVANPKRYRGYSSKCWGLTASDNDKGYSAHSPTNDLGIITPTAALSSMPFTPRQSLRAMRHFLEVMEGRVWGDCGFHDAFSPDRNWVADSYLAIDQGPIVVMLENHRTGLLWRLFGQRADVRHGLQRLGFQRQKIEERRR